MHALLLLNHKTWKSNFCVKLLSCKRNFFSRNFLGQLHRETPQNGAPKHPFFERLKLECYFFFAISRYLTDKYFDIVWGCHPPGYPPNGPIKNQFFERLNLGCYFFLISADHSRRRWGGRGGGRPPIRFKTSKIRANGLFIWANSLDIWAHHCQNTVSVLVKTFFFWRPPSFGQKNRLNFRKDLFFFWRRPQFGQKKTSQF